MHLDKLESLPSLSTTVFLLSFYCIKLYIIQTGLPFNFHGTKSQLHSSKMESGGGMGRGGGGGAGLVTVSNATRLPVTEREPFGEQRGCFAFFFPHS